MPKTANIVSNLGPNIMTAAKVATAGMISMPSRFSFPYPLIIAPYILVNFLCPAVSVTEEIRTSGNNQTIPIQVHTCPNLAGSLSTLGPHAE